jgi:hypothetical protein
VKTFLKKFASFVVVLVLSTFVMSMLPHRNPLYGNSDFQIKLDSIEKKANNYNFYFFGSSRIATGLNPAVFDSAMSTRHVNSHSFNMATYGTWFSESEYLINAFTNKITGNGSVLFIEFDNVMSIDWDKIDTDKNLYYQNAANYRFIAEYARENATRSAKDFLVSMHFLTTHGLTAILNLLNLGKSEDICDYGIRKIDFGQGGFKALHRTDTSRLPDISRFARNADKSFQSNAKGNAAFMHQISRIIQTATEHGFKVYFILTPKKYTGEMAAIFKSIPPKNCMNYATFLLQQTLYDKSLWSDNLHFNIEGAKRYTEFVVAEYIQNMEGI